MSKLRIAPRGTPSQPDPAQLPDAARAHLGVLVTELNGIATVLRTDLTVVDHNNAYAAVAEWVDRIATDLGAMECRRYPIPTAEAP